MYVPGASYPTQLCSSALRHPARIVDYCMHTSLPTNWHTYSFFVSYNVRRCRDCVRTASHAEYSPGNPSKETFDPGTLQREAEETGRRSSRKGSWTLTEPAQPAQPGQDGSASACSLLHWTAVSRDSGTLDGFHLRHKLPHIVLPLPKLTRHALIMFSPRPRRARRGTARFAGPWTDLPSRQMWRRGGRSSKKRMRTPAKTVPYLVIPKIRLHSIPLHSTQLQLPSPPLHSTLFFPQSPLKFRPSSPLPSTCPYPPSPPSLQLTLPSPSALQLRGTVVLAAPLHHPLGSLQVWNRSSPTFYRKRLF